MTKKRLEFSKKGIGVALLTPSTYLVLQFSESKTVKFFWWWKIGGNALSFSFSVSLSSFIFSSIFFSVFLTCLPTFPYTLFVQFSCLCISVNVFAHTCHLMCELHRKYYRMECVLHFLECCCLINCFRQAKFFQVFVQLI